MRLLRTRTQNNEVDKHMNNANESAKYKNKANEVPKHKNDAKGGG